MTNEQYYELIKPYEDSTRLLLTRLETLKRGLSRGEYGPVHDIQQRIKSKRSIEKKLARMGYTKSVSNAKDHLRDIAGIRVICYFEDDVYDLAAAWKRQPDLIFIKEKDYIREPKANGYRSLHMVVGVPLCHKDRTEYYPVELQLRTIGMDFWAGMEHRVCYKHSRDDKPELQEILLQYAGIIQTMEQGFREFREDGEGL